MVLTVVLTFYSGPIRVSAAPRAFSASPTTITSTTTNADEWSTIPGSDTSGARFIFRPFPDDDGKVQSASIFWRVGPSRIDASNTFFQTTFGTNGQSCSTCHLPSEGGTIHVQTIQNAFAASGGSDPLFRFNDTANNPNSPLDVGSVSDRQQAYSLALALGVMRIGIVVPKSPADGGTAEFVIAPQSSSQFGDLPSVNDPQHPGVPSISLFRRPLATMNMRFNSAVLWDGRANISNLRGQVTGAAKTLLLNPAPAPAAADDVARFMLSVVLDQVFDDRSSFPPSFAGYAGADGAKGGVNNLVRLAKSPTAPCLFDVNGNPTRALTPSYAPRALYPGQGATVLTPKNCTPVVQGGPNMTTFQAWGSAEEAAETDVVGVSRQQIAHGENIFNTAFLHVPSDMVIPGLTGTEAHCTTCHSVNNLGNNANGSFFVRLGSDSVPILKELADAHPETPSLQDFVTRTAMLPQYCLRSTAAGAPPLPGPGVTGAVDCGSYSGAGDIPGDVITSDPGRAMITGKWADIGKFKPPILRGLAPRSPYFHGSAADSTVTLVDFYNARFSIGLSDTEKQDLVRFIEAH